ncbi:MAG: hypothetical protein RL095_1235 [Verrucomicrobiota bacterium]|jgi:acetate kinase
MSILVINAGSSSLKFSLINLAGGERLLSGLADRLGTSEASWKLRLPQEDRLEKLPGLDLDAAMGRLLDLIRSEPRFLPQAVGHRVVHGGEHFDSAVEIDDGVEEAIEACIALAPLHNPGNLAGIRLARSRFAGLRQVAVFDTAFHRSLPVAASTYAVPASWTREHRVRRYGFHGSSHAYVAGEAARRLGRPLEALHLVTAHLGNGASLCAVRNGRSVDTTMGFTPLEGLVMGSRCGDLDAGILPYMCRRLGCSLDELNGILNRGSGLLGISELSGDMRCLRAAAGGGHAAAALAIEVFVHRLAKGIAAMTSSLDRLDALVFTGGIGENDANLRAETLSRLKIFGFALDPAANSWHGNACGGRIDLAGRVLVVPTDEELEIARQTRRTLDESAPD